MTVRRLLLSLLSLFATGAAALAQPGAGQPTVAQQAMGAQASTINTDDGLSLKFADGIVAIAEDKVFTVDDVRSAIQPFVQEMQREAHSQEEFNQKLESVEDSLIQQMIDRVLVIKEFHKDEKRRIPESFVDNDIARRLNEQFDNDRSKFLKYLRDKGETLRDYRRDVEEDIIYNYMRQQQEKTESVVSPVRIEQFYKENKDQFYQEDQVYMRMIELTRNNGETDAQLKTKADAIIARLRSGEKFEDLAKQFSEDIRRNKGGDYGLKKRADILPEFGTPLFNLKKGEFTDPIITPAGCFILYAQDRKYAGIQPLAEVRTQIETLLSTQMTNTAEEKWLERLRRDGYVKHF